MLPFFAELKKLRAREPMIAFKGLMNENCSYNDNIYGSRNCYLCFDGDKLEHCSYVDMSFTSRSCMDCSYVSDCELCYECIDCWNCYNCAFCQQCRDTVDSSYSFDLLGCNACFGCVGLRHKKYCLFNEQLSETEWKRQVALWKTRPRETILGKVLELRRTAPHLFSWQFKTEHCVGDFLLNSKNCFMCFDSQGCQDSGYLTRSYNIYSGRTVDSWDCTFNVDLTGCYECVQVGDGWNALYTHYSEHVRDMMFCDCCDESHDLFGCINLKRRSFCILNEQLSQEAYFKKRAEILAEIRAANAWGQWYEVMQAAV